MSWRNPARTPRPSRWPFQHSAACANKGIGLAIARQLGQQNFSVWLGSRDRDCGEKAAAKLQQSGIDALPVVIDVTDDESVRAAAALLANRTDKLDVLVNKAGISLGAYPPASEERIDDIRAMFEVNTLGPVRVTQRRSCPCCASPHPCASS